MSFNISLIPTLKIFVVSNNVMKFSGTPKIQFSIQITEYEEKKLLIIKDGRRFVESNSKCKIS